jgi:guanylate kinase
VIKRTRGLLFVLSGPSGVGKDTVLTRLRQRDPSLVYSISCTTRPRRPGEVDGVNYRFVDEVTFTRMAQANEFLEWAWVHRHRYGTPAAPVQKHLEAGHDVLLKIDVQGADQVKLHMHDAVFIFLLPPSLKELRRRLRERASEQSQELRVRVEDASRELEYVWQYDFAVTNDDAECATDLVHAIVRAERARLRPDHMARTRVSVPRPP